MEQESPFAAQMLPDTLGALLVGLGLAAACVSDTHGFAIVLLNHTCSVGSTGSTVHSASSSFVGAHQAS
jgi:hypothetical protein